MTVWCCHMAVPGNCLHKPDSMWSQARLHCQPPFDRLIRLVVLYRTLLGTLVGVGYVVDLLRTRVTKYDE